MAPRAAIRVREFLIMTFSLPIGDRIVGGEICSYPELRFARTGHSREVSFLTRNGHWHGHRAGGSVPASFPAMNLPISSPTPPNCSSLLADGEHQANRRPDEKPDGKIYKNSAP